MIDTIFIVHHTHIDFGYTDHQQTAMRKLIGYVDDALDAIDRSRDYPDAARFRWTQEVFLPLIKWWKRANAAKRRRLEAAVRDGLFEICAMPVNVSNLADAREWAYMLDMLPESIRKFAPVQTIMQNDVNGIPRAGMRAAWDRGVRMLWMGPNSYYGMAPQPAPFAFDWEIDSGKRMQVWCNSSYNDGTFMFNKNWREGPVPAAWDMRYRNPDHDDIFRCDPESLAASHALLTENLERLTGSSKSAAATDGFTKCRTRTDYPYSAFITSIAGQWRCDNDPPFAALSDFVRAWNAAGYVPALKLCTVSQAMAEFRTAAGDLTVRSGVWTDYWGNLLASFPMEMSAIRTARRALDDAERISTKKLNADQKRQRSDVLYNLMMTDEHTFGSWDCAKDPDCANSRGQIAEKQIFAYRALEGARMLLRERAEAVYIDDPYGTIRLCNTGIAEKRAHLRLPANCLRGKYCALKDAETGDTYALRSLPGGSNFCRPTSVDEFSEDNVTRTFGDLTADSDVLSDGIPLKPGSSRLLTLCKEAAAPASYMDMPAVRTDALGWPTYIAFENDACAVIDGDCGVFKALNGSGISPRWSFKDVFDEDDVQKRTELCDTLFDETNAEYEPAICKREADRIIWTQKFNHPALRIGRRTLKLNLYLHRVELELKIDRLCKYDPEIFYLGFEAPIGDAAPTATLAEDAFCVPEDSLPGTCRDFTCIDGWIGFGERIQWNWFAADSALVCIGDTRACKRLDHIVGSPRRIWAQLFDNTWDTNFNTNEWGMMTFRFFMQSGIVPNPVRYFEDVATEPVVVVKTKNR